MWAYFNVWDNFRNVQDRPFVFDLPFVVVPTTRCLSEKEGKKLVGYYSDNNAKVLPPSLRPTLVDGGHSCYGLNAREIKLFDQMASEDNNFTDIEIISFCTFVYGKGPLNGSCWRMLVKRMRVPGKAELEELSARAIRAAQELEDADAQHGTGAEHGTVAVAVVESSAEHGTGAEHGTSAESSQ